MTTPLNASILEGQFKTVTNTNHRLTQSLAAIVLSLLSSVSWPQTTYEPIHTQDAENLFIYMPPAPPPDSNAEKIGWILQGYKGYDGRNEDCGKAPGGGGDGYTPPPITQTLTENYTYANDDAIVYVSRAGSGGKGGNGGDQGLLCGGNYNGRTGGKGAAGGDIDLIFNPTTAINKKTYLHTGLYAYTGIFLQSLGGNGGDGGANGGNGGSGGVGGTVKLENNVSFKSVYQGGYGIFAQSLGGWGGSGSDAKGIFWSGNGGVGSIGAKGGTVQITNTGNILTPYGVPIFAQSMGGKGGDGGGSTSLFAGVGGAGGFGGPGGDVSVKNLGNLSSEMIGSFGIFAQSVGGGGGSGGSAAGLYSLGAKGGEAASAGSVAVSNSGQIELKGASSIGIYSQSVGGGGGIGGLASGVVTFGGSGGDGGNGSSVLVTNSGLVSTGDSCRETDAQGRCVAKWNTGQTNGGGIGVLAQSIGGGGGVGGMGISSVMGSFVSIAVSGSGGSGGTGGSVYANNSGSIATNEVNSSAILAQSIGGGGGSAGGAISADTSFLAAFGYAKSEGGGSGGNGGKVGVNCISATHNLACSESESIKIGTPASGAYILTSGASSPGILAQSIGGGGGNGGFAIAAAASSSFSAGLSFGGKGEAAGNGNNVYVSPNGVAITTHGSDSPGVEASSIGGGGGNGGQSFSGAFGANAAISIAMGGKGGTGGEGGDVVVENINRTALTASTISTTGDRSFGLAAQSIGGGGGSGGASVSASIASGTLNIGIGGSGRSGMHGGNSTITNDGLISTSGFGASAIAAQSIGGGGGNGGAVFSGSISEIGGKLSVGGSGGSAADSKTTTVVNNGNLTSIGGGAPVLLAQSIAGGGGNGGIAFSGSASLIGLSADIGGKGDDGGTAGKVVVKNLGTIYNFLDGSTTLGNSPGILAQSIGGGGGSGGFSASVSVAATASLALSVGGDGGKGGNGGEVNVDNFGYISTSGTNSSALVAQSIGGAGGSGGVSFNAGLSTNSGLLIAVGGKGSNGAGSDLVNVNSYGQINTLGTFSNGIVAQSIGGAGGNGGAAVSGNASINGLGLNVGGIGGSGGVAKAVGVNIYNSIKTDGDQSVAVLAQSIGGSGGNGGSAITGSLSSDLSGNISFAGNGKSGGTSGNVSVSLMNSSSEISTSGLSASAIVAQSISGSGGNGGFTVSNSSSSGISLSSALSGHGGNAIDSVGSVMVATEPETSIKTTGDLSSGIVAQSIGGTGGNSGSVITASLTSSPSIENGAISIGGSASGGTGANANSVTVTSAGNIQTGGAVSVGIVAQSIGGGGGNAGTAFSLASSRDKKQGATLSISLGGTGGNAGSGGAVVVNQTGLIATGFGCDLSIKACDQSAGILAQSIGGGGGNGGNIVSLGTASAVSANIGVGGMGGYGGKSEIVNVSSNKDLTYGGIVTLGNFSSAIIAQSIAGGGGAGGSSDVVSIDDKRGATVSIGGTGGTGGQSASVTVSTGGALSTNGSHSAAILAQSIGGGGGRGGQSFASLSSSTTYKTNLFLVGAEYGAGSMGVGDGGDISSMKGDSAEPSTKPSLSAKPASGLASSISVGGFGGSAGTASNVLVESTSAISTSGDFSQGIYAQSIGGGGGSGGVSGAKASGGVFTLSAGIGGFGGSGGKGGDVEVIASNSITTTGLNSSAIYVQSVGGGGGQGGGSANSAKTSSNALAIGVGGFGGSGNTGGLVLVTNNAILNTQSANSSGIYAQSIGGGGGDGGSSYVSAVEPNPEVPGTSSVTSAFKGKLSSSTAGSASSGANSAAGQNGSQQGSQAGTDQGRALGISLGGFGGEGGNAGKVTITNNGDINTGLNITGTSESISADYSYAILAQSIGGGGGTGGQSSSNSDTSKTSAAFAIGGSGAGGGNGSDVTVTNFGNLTTNGSQAAAIFAQSVGGGGGTGGDASSTTSIAAAKSVAFGLGGEGATGGNGGKVSVSTSTGEIVTYGVLSDAIHAQSVGGGGGNGGSSTTASEFKFKDVANADSSSVVLLSDVKASTNIGLAFAAGLGGTGGAGGSGGIVEVTNGSRITTKNNSSNGVFAQSIGGGGGSTGSDTNRLLGATYSIGLQLGTIAAPGNGSGVTVLSNADIKTYGHSSFGIIGQSIGGGGGFASLVNTTESTFGDSNLKFGLGSIGGKDLLSGSVKLGSDAFPLTDWIITSGHNSSAIVAQSIGGGGGYSSSVNDVTSASGNVYSNASLGAIASTVPGSLIKALPSQGGNSSTVSILSNASISTNGSNSLGLIAQSVGGGGGVAAFASELANIYTLNESYTLGAQDGSSGLGKAVEIVQNGAWLETRGNNSIAIAAQSIGGGGGIVLSNSSAQSSSVSKAIESIGIGGSVSAGSGADAVTVTSGSLISTKGSNSVGILAQSIAGGGGIVNLSVGGLSTPGESSKVNIGGFNSESASASDVKVTVNNSINTEGAASIGVLAQSVGGGGGTLLTTGISNITPTFTGGSGNGGNVTVNVNASISVSGAGSIGVIAQSVGGGGGIYINESGYQAGSGGGSGTAGTVSVYVNNVIQANNGTGIYAGAAKGANDPNVTIGKGASVLATTGTAIAVDGLTNNIHNEGTVAATNPHGIAVDVRNNQGSTEIFNKGVLSGALVNTGSNINIQNHKDGRLYLPSPPNLGNGVLTNSGYLMFNSLGEVATSSTNHTGSYIQTSTGVLGSRIDFASVKSDILDITNSAQFVLEGKVRPVLVNAGLIHPGAVETTVLTSSAPAGLTTVSGVLGIDENSAIMSYYLKRSGNDLKLTSAANFAPAGLSQFGRQVGQAIGQYQSAGSNAFFQAATAQLVEQPTVAALDQAYQGLAGTAIQAVPQAVFQAVSQGVGSYTDRMNDWRVSTATAKSSRMAAFSQTQRYASAKSVNSLVDAANDDGLIGGGRSGPWVSLFQSNVFSKSLTDRIVGGTIGFEMENDRRNTIGGIGVTLSQSGYSYNNAPTPITPGNTTNVGLSFYGMGRGENAYLSGIGYLGGGNSSFTRQLQTMNFYSSTNVSLMSYVAAARIESGYSFEPFRRERSNLQITPFVAVQPTYIHQNAAQDNFSSMGLGTGFNYSATDNTAVPVFAGLEFSGNHITESGIKISPFIRASWMAETKQNGQMGANYSGQGVNVFFSGSPNLGNAMLYKVGSVFGGERVSGYFTLDYDYGNASYAYRNYGVTGGLKYAF